MSFDDVKRLIGQALYPDHTIISKLGLSRLADHYTAYCMSQGGTSYCLLLKKGTSQKSAAALPEADAANGIVIVLEKHGPKWVKVWPAAAAKS